MMAAGAAEAERVGPVLEAGDAGWAVVIAIRQLNQGVTVKDRGSYLRVSVPGRCFVTRRAIEASLGRPFRLPADLERIMPSFKGRFAVGEDAAVWTHEGPG